MNVNMGGGNLRTFTRDKNLDIVKGIGILLIILHIYFHTFYNRQFQAYKICSQIGIFLFPNYF